MWLYLASAQARGLSECHCVWSSRSADMFFFSSRRRHTRFDCDWSSDVCSSDLGTVSARIWCSPDQSRGAVRLIGGTPYPLIVSAEARGKRHAQVLRVDGFRRSEERRVGQECRSRWSPDHSKKKNVERGVIDYSV